MSKIYLKINYHNRDLAKSLGAQWDFKRKEWYAEPGSDLSLIYSWIATEVEIKVIEKNISDFEICERFEQLPSRFNNGREIIKFFGIDIKKFKFVVNGFCIFCDTHIENKWTVGGDCHIHHTTLLPTLSPKEEYFLFKEIGSKNQGF